MNITEKQRTELSKHGWDIYENLYTIPLYSDEIGNFDELVEQLNVIPTEGDAALIYLLRDACLKKDNTPSWNGGIG